MRFELSGIAADVSPKTIIFEDDDDFDVDTYLALGYTDIDIICIGGGGGRGGGIDTAGSGTLIRIYGGEGGGGGYHRVQAKLSLLPSSCPIVIGDTGTPGTEVSVPGSIGSTTDGDDGHYSSFNDIFCCASGGTGGKRAQTATLTDNPHVDGGEGGIGNSLAVGGGGAGGDCGDPDDDPSTSTPGEDGPIIDNIGHGGGGGAGGISNYGDDPETTEAYLEATSGGRGSYDPDNLLVTGDGEDAQDGSTDIEASKPGRGGGATAKSLTGISTVYGQAGTPGVVVVRLS